MPKNNLSLDEYEKEVLDFVKNQHPTSIENLESEKLRYKKIAQDQIEKRSVSILDYSSQI